MLHNFFFGNKNTSKKLKLRLKNTIIGKTFNICVRNLVTNKDRQKANKHFRKESVQKNFRPSI